MSHQHMSCDFLVQHKKRELSEKGLEFDTREGDGKYFSNICLGQKIKTKRTKPGLSIVTSSSYCLWEGQDFSRGFLTLAQRQYLTTECGHFWHCGDCC